MDRPTVVMLHALGASGRSWQEVTAHLSSEAKCLTPDLPGFGEHADMGARSIAETVDWLAAYLAHRALGPTFLVGHSMGGKYATVLAARAARETGCLPGLRGVVLFAASPPSPEPMDESRRSEMISWFADGSPSHEEAATFVTNNLAHALPEDRSSRAIADVRRSSPAAWIDWLKRGAQEDWSDRVGVLNVPATIVAGAKDGDLGEANQRRLNLPHYADASVEVVSDAAHLLPYERPEIVADVIGRMIRQTS